MELFSNVYEVISSLCSALQKMKYMESSLSIANHAYPDCSNMVSKLRAMTDSVEEQVQSQRKQTSFLTELAGRTTPKGLHCLSMRLTTEYFMLHSEQQRVPNQQFVYSLDLFHYVTLSDNVLAAAVVVNSTVSNALVIALSLTTMLSQLFLLEILRIFLLQT